MGTRLNIGMETYILSSCDCGDCASHEAKCSYRKDLVKVTEVHQRNHCPVNDDFCAEQDCNACALFEQTHGYEEDGPEWIDEMTEEDLITLW